MNRNTESHFSLTPTVNIGRSKFDRSFDMKTTFNTGDLIPVYCSDVLPGDSIRMRMSEIVRMQTPIAPVMDNAYLDTYFFFVPNRLIWDHFKAFMGENDTTPWTQTNEYQIPQIIAPDTGWKKGSLADYFGYKTKVGGYKASALPFRAYVKIWNDWFRDENLKNPCYMSTGDADIHGTDKTDLGALYDYVVDTEKGAAPCKAAKLHDYFTSCLPGAQKGTAVNIPLGSRAPINWTGEDPYTSGTAPATAMEDLQFRMAYQGTSVGSGLGNSLFYGVSEDGATSTAFPANKYSGLYADLTNAVGATVNQLRQAFAIQKYYEKDALYGTRYIESVRAHFGVINPDFRVQRSEYLGGKRIPININQVIQTDATGNGIRPTYTDPDNPSPSTLTWETVDKTPQGNAAAYSVTQDANGDLFNHSFTEHGWIIGLAVVRTDHGYQQGLNKMFIRKNKFDFYTPEFANLGNMAVLGKEIYLDGTSADDEVFGYQEAWADYRYQPNIVTGEMRSDYDLSLDIWHWADDYSSRPYLDSDWIDEPKENVERTLAVQDQDQFFGDFYFGAIWTRPMPLYSIPGLIDHH